MKAAERQLRIRQMFESQGFPGPGNPLPRVGGLRIERSPRPGRTGRTERSEARIRGRGSGAAAREWRAFDFMVESGRFSDEKSRIARLTAGLIEDGQTVILDGGSTVAAVARELAAKSLHIVTNSLPIAESTGGEAEYRTDADRRLSRSAHPSDAGPAVRTDAGPDSRRCR